MEYLSSTKHLLAEHREMLEKGGVDLDSVIAFRQELHRYPEGKLQEFKTIAMIKERLAAAGLEPVECTPTGCYVDIEGTAEAQHDPHGISSVALRSDHDGLLMPDKGDHDHVSQTSFSHACGHDGHTATLIAAAEYLALH